MYPDDIVDLAGEGLKGDSSATSTLADKSADCLEVINNRYCGLLHAPRTTWWHSIWFSSYAELYQSKTGAIRDNAPPGWTRTPVVICTAQDQAPFDDRRLVSSDPLAQHLGLQAYHLEPGAGEPGRLEMLTLVDDVLRTGGTQMRPRWIGAHSASCWMSKATRRRAIHHRVCPRLVSVEQGARGATVTELAELYPPSPPNRYRCRPPCVRRWGGCATPGPVTSTSAGRQRLILTPRVPG